MTRALRRLLAALVVVASGLLLTMLSAFALGRVGVVVTHGTSMHPVYDQGDLVLIARQASYRAGDVVGYTRQGHPDVVLHRIVGGNRDGYLFKGDSNPSIDPTRPSDSQLAGRAVVRIPQGGIWLGRLTSPPALGLFTFGLLAGGGTAVKTRRRPRTRRTAVSRHAARASSPVAALSPMLRVAAGVTATVGICGLTLGALAFSGPLTARNAAAPPHAGASMTFSYRADVGRSPAYDGTTVTAPDPVFRSRARSVDVQYTYRGSPGTVTVAAQLSTPGGWHSTVPLRAAARTNGSYTGSVTLDLTSLEARAKAASVVTGLPAQPVVVAVTPQVLPAAGTPFSPTLSFALTPLQLTLTGSAKNLVVTADVPAPQPGQVQRRLGAYGQTMTVATARRVAPILLLAVLLAAALLTLLARRTAPSGEAAQIRRRYGALLIRVHPMPTPAGRPVVEVTEFATLAKLAERYGLLVMHWSRSDVETFVVQDEGATYRYRASSGDPQVAPAAMPEAADLTPIG